MPSVFAAAVKLPFERLSTSAMKLFSKARAASSNRMPLSTISRMSRSICSRTADLCLGLLQFAPGQAPVRLEVFLACSRNHLVRQPGDRRLLVPPDLLEVVADVLLVEAGLASAGPVRV